MITFLHLIRVIFTIKWKAQTILVDLYTYGPHGTTYTSTHEIRHTGFLLGNVVDMFQFNVRWPSWMPWVEKIGISSDLEFC